MQRVYELRYLRLALQYWRSCALSTLLQKPMYPEESRPHKIRQAKERLTRIIWTTILIKNARYRDWTVLGSQGVARRL